MIEGKLICDETHKWTDLINRSGPRFPINQCRLRIIEYPVCGDILPAFRWIVYASEVVNKVKKNLSIACDYIPERICDQYKIDVKRMLWLEENCGRLIMMRLEPTKLPSGRVVIMPRLRDKATKKIIEVILPHIPDAGLFAAHAT